MKIVLQRVIDASVKVNNELVGSISHGLLLLVGISIDDTEVCIEKLAQKIVHMRIFNDDEGKMNKSVIDVNGGILSISQFTLYASTKKGNRPSYIAAARPEQAKPLYNELNRMLQIKLGKPIETGIFGADMKVTFQNDGPVTILLDSEEICPKK